MRENYKNNEEFKSASRLKYITKLYFAVKKSADFDFPGYASLKLAGKALALIRNETELRRLSHTIFFKYPFFYKNRSMKIISFLYLFFPFQVATAQADFATRLSDAAISIIDHTIRYTPDYISISYPNGDVPAHTGVCTDVVIRAYRKLGIDLQKEVHEDIKARFSEYPKIWGLKHPDKNIDHRRVPNLQTFFKKRGKVLPVTQNPKDYKPGDIVTWMLPNDLPHIGIVVHKKSKDRKRYLVVHNIGSGQVAEDILFNFNITGHYSYRK